VNVTEVPVQTGFAETETETLTGCTGFTVMVMTLDVAGFPVGQETLEVSRQEITSPFTGAHLNMELFVPDGIPLTIHW